MVQSLFLAHGAPTIAIENNEYTKFLGQLGENIKPKAIVIFTAHWESEMLTISYTDEVYNTIYDFYGFPRELYEIKYRAKGSSLIASKIQNKLLEHGINAEKDMKRGLDHGSWTILKHLYPKADIPVIQISVNSSLSIKDQLNIGEAIKSLGEEDILIIGSGVTVHNLRLVNWDATKTDAWAEEFDDWLIDKIKTKDKDSLVKYKELAPKANLAVPTLEHFVPLFIAMGAGNKVIPKVLNRSYELGNLSYLCFEF